MRGKRLGVVEIVPSDFFFFFFFCCANVFSDIEKAFSGCAGVCPFRDRLSEDRLLINLEEKILVKFNFSLLY